jgi:hypothetical protein
MIDMKYLILSLLVMFVYTSDAQFVREYKDTLDFAYKFQPGDTLIYSAESLDSIQIDYGDIILKNTRANILIVCDSAKDGRFFLTQKMIAFSTVQSDGTINDQKISESDWIMRPVRIELDSSGKRYSWSIAEKDPDVSPLGDFCPYILMEYNKTRIREGSSWMYEGTDVIPENGNPPPLISHSNLFDALYAVDTLNHKCSVIEYIRTGQGDFTVNTVAQKFRKTNIINSYGRIYFSTDLQVPIHIFSTCEQKIKLKFSKDEELPGNHYTTVTYRLINFIRHED